MAEDIFDRDAELGGVLQQVAGQLKGSLGNIHSALERVAPAELRDEDKNIDLYAAVLSQSYYRLLRLANNLSDAAELEHPGHARLRNDDIVGFCSAAMDRARQPRSCWAWSWPSPARRRPTSLPWTQTAWSACC